MNLTDKDYRTGEVECAWCADLVPAGRAVVTHPDLPGMAYCCLNELELALHMYAGRSYMDIWRECHGTAAGR